jgi:hypothetical protein
VVTRDPFNTENVGLELNKTKCFDLYAALLWALIVFLLSGCPVCRDFEVPN